MERDELKKEILVFEQNLEEMWRAQDSFSSLQIILKGERASE